MNIPDEIDYVFHGKSIVAKGTHYDAHMSCMIALIESLERDNEKLQQDDSELKRLKRWKKSFTPSLIRLTFPMDLVLFKKV